MTYRSFLGGVGDLIGHIAATALLFVAIMAATWAISWSFSYLDEIHRFPTIGQTILTGLEVVLLAIDALLCIALVSYGAKRFIRGLGRM